MTDAPYTIDDARDCVETIFARLSHGCRNHGCLIESPRGMATNGGCRCQPKQIAKELFDLACRVEKMGYRWVKAPPIKEKS